METQNLLLTRGRVEILRQHAFGTPSGTEDFNSNSSGTSTRQARVKMSKNNEISEENIVLVTADQLNEEQKADMAKLTEQFPAMYLQTYSRTRQGTIIQKSKVVLLGPGEGVSTSATGNDQAIKTEDDTRCATLTLQDRIDSAVHSALINEFGVLVNTLTNMVKSVLDGSIYHYKPQGPIFLPENKFPPYWTLRTDLSTAPQPMALIPPPSAQPVPTMSLVLTKQTERSPRHTTEDRLAQWMRGNQALTTSQQPVIEPVRQAPINPTSAAQPQFPLPVNPPLVAAYSASQGNQQYSSGQYDAPNLNHHFQPYSPRQYRPESFQF